MNRQIEKKDEISLSKLERLYCKGTIEMTEEVDVRLVSGMSERKSVAKFDWLHSKAESIILMTYCG